MTRAEAHALLLAAMHALEALGMGSLAGRTVLDRGAVLVDGAEALRERAAWHMRNRRWVLGQLRGNPMYPAAAMRAWARLDLLTARVLLEVAGGLEVRLVPVAFGERLRGAA